eukprot:816116-Amphidinium_carterae.1
MGSDRKHVGVWGHKLKHCLQRQPHHQLQRQQRRQRKNTKNNKQTILPRITRGPSPSNRDTINK